MRLLREANRFCLRLWRDESGVVLAVTVVVFLTLFMVGSAVYAIGETVRERLELQNAADAAAYSAALVQADAISRIGAINRAMAWTYLHMCRYEQDYIVDKWLELVVKKFWEDYRTAQTFNLSGTCNWGDPTFFWAGISQAQHLQVLLNGHHRETIARIEAARAQAAGQRKSYGALAPRIDDCRTNIKNMNDAEVDIIDTFPGVLRQTCIDSLRANTRPTVNDTDSPAGGADLQFKLEPDVGVHSSYFEVEGGEEEFLDYIDKKPRDLQLSSGGGENGWFELKPAEGVKRGYRRHYEILRAEWQWYSTKWKLTKAGCILVGTRSGSRFGGNAIYGDDGSIYVDKYYNTEECKPRKLKPSYFEGDGTVVVGVARRMNNPWQFVVQGLGPGERGLFDSATLNKDARFMWAAAAARAGYRIKGKAEGEYEMTWWNVPPALLWNIKWSDWDAELLALGRAWTYGEDRRWQGGTQGGAVLADLSGGGWEALYGGGGGLGNQTAPATMGGGGAVAYGAAEKWIRH